MSDDYDILMDQRDILTDGVTAGGAVITGGGCTTGAIPVMDFSYTTLNGDHIWVEIRVVHEDDQHFHEVAIDDAVQVLQEIRDQRDRYHASLLEGAAPPAGYGDEPEALQRLGGETMSRSQVRRILATEAEEAEAEEEEAERRRDGTS